MWYTWKRRWMISFVKPSWHWFSSTVILFYSNCFFHEYNSLLWFLGVENSCFRHGMKDSEWLGKPVISFLITYPSWHWFSSRVILFYCNYFFHEYNSFLWFHGVEELLFQARHDRFWMTGKTWYSNFLCKFSNYFLCFLQVMWLELVMTNEISLGVLQRQSILRLRGYLMNPTRQQQFYDGIKAYPCL